MDWKMRILRRAMERRGPGSPHGDAPETHEQVSKLLAFVDQVARLQADDDSPVSLPPAGAVTTLSGLIHEARRMSDMRPPWTPHETLGPYSGNASGVAIVDEHYPFTAPSAPNMVPCTHCDGDGEVIDFPNETDERMVACPACGGQGEVISINKGDC